MKKMGIDLHQCPNSDTLFVRHSEKAPFRATTGCRTNPANVPLGAFAFRRFPSQGSRPARFPTKKEPHCWGSESSWWSEGDLNPRHADFQSAALPTELPGQILIHKNQNNMATRKGLEPSTSGVTGRRSNQLNYRAISVV